MRSAEGILKGIVVSIFAAFERLLYLAALGGPVAGVGEFREVARSFATHRLPKAEDEGARATPCSTQEVELESDVSGRGVPNVLMYTRAVGRNEFVCQEGACCEGSSLRGEPNRRDLTREETERGRARKGREGREGSGGEGRRGEGSCA